MKNSTIRKIFLIVLTFFFFLGIAVFVIIITRGGIITKDGIVETGVVKITLEPNNIKYSVYIDDTIAEVKDNRVNNLEDGTYNLKIESDGYTPWEKDVVVTSRLVTDLYVRLFPENFALNQVTKSNIDKAFFSEDGEYVYYVIKNSEFGSEKGIWRLKLTSSQFIFGNQQNSPEKISEIISPLADPIEKTKYELIPSLDNQKILFHNTETNQRYILDATSLNKEILNNISEKLKYSPQEVYWFNGSNSLIIKDNNVIYEHDLANNSDILIKYDPEGKLIYGVSNEFVTLFDNFNKKFYSYKNKSLNELAIVNNELPNEITDLFVAKNNEYMIIVKTKDSYKYINIEKSIIKNIGDLSYEFLKIASLGEDALFKKDTEIYSFTIKEVLATNTLVTNFTKVVENYSSDTDRLDYAPLDKHIVIYLNSDNSLYIGENDGANKYEVLKNHEIKQRTFGINSDGKSLFVLLVDEAQNDSNAKRANLYRMDLDTP